MVDKTQTPSAPPPVRDAIRAAVDSEKEKLQAAEKQEVERKEERNEEPVEKRVEEKPVPNEEKVEVKTEEKKEEKKVEEKPSEKIEPSEKTEVKTEAKSEEKEPAKPKSKAPFGIDKDLRAIWDDLPEVARDRISKLTKESLDIKANDGRRAHLREVEQVLSPYMPQMQASKVTPAQVVKRIMEYTDALSHPQNKYTAFAQIIQDFQIDLNHFDRLYGRGNPQDEIDDNQQNQNTNDQLHPALNQKLDNIITRFDQYENSQRSQNDNAAQRDIENWAGFNPTTQEYTKKPFFQHVRQAMFNLIQSGAVPLVNGKIDLDGAYDAACYAHPEIREYILEEQANAEAEKAAIAEKQRLDALNKARNAGASLRPSAPPSNRSAPIKPNGAGRSTDVRSSLKATIAELRNR